jgi:hypothetical protein
VQLLWLFINMEGIYNSSYFFFLRFPLMLLVQMAYALLVLAPPALTLVTQRLRLDL